MRTGNLSLILCLLLPLGAFAESVPTLINYQGRLLDSSGNPISSNVTINLLLYTNDMAGASVYAENIGTVTVNNGLYQFRFGMDSTDLKAALTHPEIWLSVVVNGSPLNPRQRLVSVPYAVRAGEADRVEGEVIAGNNTNLNPRAGSIRWTGTDFEGFTGVKWVSLVQNPVPNVNLGYVAVGHANNGNDPGGSGLGAVTNDFLIGRYEVTNGEYVDFLNAVDAGGTNDLALFNANMTSSSHGGISFDSGAASGAKYVAKTGFTNKPVNYVSFYDALRFCNWRHHGSEVGGDTETGAYTLLGGTPTPSNGATVERNSGAKIAVPTEDEWYKSGYHQPASEGGDANDYWQYPTRSNATPASENPPGGANSANYWPSVPNSVTEVGAYLIASGPYGTFDQGGNVAEWNETIKAANRSLRGGSWFGAETLMKSTGTFSLPPGVEDFFIGFRVAIP